MRSTRRAGRAIGHFLDRMPLEGDDEARGQTGAPDGANGEGGMHAMQDLREEQEQEEQLTLPETEQVLSDAGPASAVARNGQDEDLALPDQPSGTFDIDAAVEGEQDAQGGTDGSLPLPQLQAEFRRFVGPLAAFTKVKASDPRALERFDAALKRLPPGETLGQALDELRERAARALEDARRERIAAFRPLEVEYVRAAREAGKSLRERANGWRVDMLELQLQREQARARFFYNREALVPWSPIGGPEDLANLEERARGLLGRAAYPDEMLTTVFWDAYEGERARRRAADRPRPETVPLLDFYRGVRVALVRYELEEQAPDKKLRYGELPRWAFLYNLDRYRALGTAVPEERRLGLQTGSQQESRTIGVVVNGLDAQQDYKTMCFILPAKGAA